MPDLNQKKQTNSSQIREGRIGDFLLRRNILTQSQLDEALSQQEDLKYKGSPEKLGKIIIRKGFASENDIALWSSQLAGVEYITRSLELSEVDKQKMAMFEHDFLYRNEVVILKTGQVVVSDPLDFMLRDQIKNKLSSYSVFVVSTSRNIINLLKEFFQESESYRGGDSQGEADSRLKEIFQKAVYLENVSDIHLEPVSVHKGRIRFRRDGILCGEETIQRTLYDHLVNSIKFRAQITTDERLPQDGWFSVTTPEKTNIRVATFPTVEGEAVILRLLQSQQEIKMLDELCFDEKTLNSLDKLKNYPEGIFIVSGPTGSGKTTTLYAVLDRIYSKTRKVITIEDPVEYRNDKYCQGQVNEAAEFGFSKAMKHVLRADPDIILLGEIRDEQSCRTSIQASMTGHLVLTTLHASTLKNIIIRLEELSATTSLLDENLIGVMTQRLVRKICPVCAVETDITDEQKKIFKYYKIDIPGKILSANRNGCEKCLNTGYNARIPLAVVRTLDVGQSSLVKTLIEDTEDNSGYELRQKGLTAVSNRVTSFEELRRVIFL